MSRDPRNPFVPLEYPGWLDAVEQQEKKMTDVMHTARHYRNALLAECAA